MTEWKQTLKNLEQAKRWDEAIEFMEEIIAKNPDDMDAYIFMNYLLMNLIIEEYDHDRSKDPYYESLLNKYFRESYQKFSDNAEYLYLTGRTLVMGEFLVGLQPHDYEAMLNKALEMEPNNPVYKETYFWTIREEKPLDAELLDYAKTVLTEPSPVTQQLQTKGAIGDYLLMLKRNSAKNLLRSAAHCLQKQGK